jgi:poly(3-hydroxybutyrate) depolymerase
MSLKRRLRRLRGLAQRHQPVTTIVAAAVGLFLLVGVALGARAIYVDSDRVGSPGCSDPQGNLMLRGRGQIEVGDEPRGFNLAVARTDFQQPVPLVVALTDDGLDRHDFDLVTQFPEIARRSGFMALTPEKTAVAQAWDLDPDGVDVRLVLDIVESVEDRMCVRTDRVYLVGFGTGGPMALHLACLEPDRFRGVAVVGGLVDIAGCAERTPLSLLAIHGTDDASFPFDGSHPEALGERLVALTGSADGPSRPAIAGRWAESNGCLGALEQLPAGPTTRMTRWECEPGQTVEFYTLERGRHVWPNPLPHEDVPAAVAVRESRMDASQVIWEFFEEEWVAPRD